MHLLRITYIPQRTKPITFAESNPDGKSAIVWGLHVLLPITQGKNVVGQTVEPAQPKVINGDILTRNADVDFSGATGANLNVTGNDGNQFIVDTSDAVGSATAGKIDFSGVVIKCSTHALADVVAVNERRPDCPFVP